ncbi:sigma-54-dependent transcriptional regulator [Paraliomyxa miuraensis]|uniref:sigma-54-dependent transcriptional regulator n=1 Tax=Paraliomyxa miuraensis TaxID=376150 RepID=UPI00225006EA|nr:sigma-54 dependent transcriptional regulator [Paraliomyxa miuraensis]MCX4240882.1 sigma-54 dependent transcriptional regulator [Paraliomyxa miuraensis]
MTEQDQQGDLEGKILVVDDERNIRRTLRMVLEGEGATVVEAATGEAALVELAAAQSPIEVIITDVMMPGISGLDLLERLRDPEGGPPPVPVIMISGHATVEDAVKATRLGAFDFFEKPLARDRVIVSVRNALRQYRSDQSLRVLRSRIRGSIIGDSEPMRMLLAQVAKVGRSKARVLITGESGSGKELVARAVHEASERRTAPFVKVNCAAIPRELIESELFGHERGAFTGATAQKPGLFEVADGGTIFLDEIGDMALGAQAKVLRVLQSGEIMRVGGRKPSIVDVRVLAATHKNLPELVGRGEFREDLYFRLNVVPLLVPPLRERPDDIPLLSRCFIDEACQDNGMGLKRLSSAALGALQRHSWPGNVRELRNVIERMVILSDGDLELHDVPPEIRGSDDELDDDGGGLSLVELTESALEIPEGLSLREFREAVERAFILRRLQDLGWNVSRTAESLGVERTHLHKKMRLLGIQRGSP